MFRIRIQAAASMRSIIQLKNDLHTSKEEKKVANEWWVACIKFQPKSIFDMFKLKKAVCTKHKSNRTQIAWLCDEHYKQESNKSRALYS